MVKYLYNYVLTYRLFHDGAERIEGSCRDNLNIVKAGGFACVTEDLSAKSIFSSDFTKTGKCNFYTSEPLRTFFRKSTCVIYSKKQKNSIEGLYTQLNGA